MVIWCRAIFVMEISVLLRIVSFLSTSLPGPAPHCQPNSTEYNPPKSLYSIIMSVDVLKGCGDLIFSSHTTLATSLVLSVHVYARYYFSICFYRFMMYCVYWPLLLLLCGLIISARKHYTIDVVVALYVTPLVYYASYWLRSDITSKELKTLNNCCNKNKTNFRYHPVKLQDKEETQDEYSFEV